MSECPFRGNLSRTTVWFQGRGVLRRGHPELCRAGATACLRSLDTGVVGQRQRLQRLFFPEGVAFSGKAFDRTVVTSPLFAGRRPRPAIQLRTGTGAILDCGGSQPAIICNGGACRVNRSCSPISNDFSQIGDGDGNFRSTAGACNSDCSARILPPERAGGEPLGEFFTRMTHQM